MTAVILCPGPSLASYAPDPANPPDITIGVNRACALHSCDWAAVLDFFVIQNYGDSFMGDPKWMTNQNSVDQAERDKHPWGFRERVVTDWLRREFWHTEQPDKTTIPWTLYSFTSALVLAAWLGATRVDIYGSDWAGTRDWDGKEHDYPDKRNEQRWDGERKLYEKVKGWMEARGIEVLRYLETSKTSIGQSIITKSGCPCELVHFIPKFCTVNSVGVQENDCRFSIAEPT